MKTHTITYHRAYNYGAVLQSYALQNAIIKLGFDNEILDYNVNNEHIFGKINITMDRLMISKIITNLYTILHLKSLLKIRERFDEFVHKYLILTQNYHTLQNIIDSPPISDCYITGSDQVWNMEMNFNPAFFLDFGNKSIKRISYAASIGNYETEAEKKEVFKHYIINFDKISVREDNDKEYIENECKRNCEVHIDPVFLLNKSSWNSLATKCDINQKYILCYPLQYHPLFSDVIKKLKELTGYIVIVILTTARTKVKGDIYIRNAGPKEFLGLFNDAEYILTSAFHGTAFSIIYEKKFYSFLSTHAPQRITNLLQLFELENRIVNSIDDITLDDIDYNQVNIRKTKEVNKSTKYLKEIGSFYE